MLKCTKFIGLDISKDTFDMHVFGGKHQKYNNSKSDFNTFYKSLPRNSHIIMEATGSYHQQLASYLHMQNIKVSIVNPLSVKRFIQMKLKKNKTDKSDAKMIAWYGKEQDPPAWIPNEKYIDICKDIHTTLAMFTKQQTVCKNKLHSLKHKGFTTGVLIRSIKRQLKSVVLEIKKLEEELLRLIKENEPNLYANITTIPGIGKKTAMLLISTTNGFKNFENHKQVIAYFGLAPQHYSSGTSVHAKSRITKTGNASVRNHLFLCSFTASIHNPQCRALYERIVSKDD